MLTGSVLNTALPGFSGVQGGTVINAVAEGVHLTTTGAFVGGISGAVGAAVDGRSITQGFQTGASGGAIAGAASAAINVLALGAAYVPDGGLGAYDNSAWYNRPVFRRNPFWYPKNGTGITLGRSLITSSDDPGRIQGEDSNLFGRSWLRAHEHTHYQQQNRLGFGAFYLRTIRQYIQVGHSHPGTLEDAANIRAA